MNKEDAGLCKDQPGEVNIEPNIYDGQVLVLVELGNDYKAMSIEAVFPFRRELTTSEWEDLQTMCDDLRMALFTAPMWDHEGDENPLEYLAYLMHERGGAAREENTR
jgi:hypothetical protein